MKQQWLQVKHVFSAALDHTDDSIAEFLDQQCGNDRELRAEVERLLKEHRSAGDFLEKPFLDREASRAQMSLPSSAAAAPGFFGTDRFILTRRLGAGAFGEVYEAFDSQRNEPVALKCLKHFDPEQLYRLKKEFRALSDMRHRNLVEVYELFSASGTTFFTMELLKGRNFIEHVRGGPSARSADDAPSFKLLRSSLSQLVQGVMALHQAGLLHRDIKPSNVLVTEEGRVVLLDFGLVKQLIDPEAAKTLSMAGTPHYSAPEQVQERALTEAADWYAVGSVMYEALTGHIPFSGNAIEVLTRKQRGDQPEPPSTIAPGVPQDLDALCFRLLSSDPFRRPGGREILQVCQSVNDLSTTRDSDESPAPVPKIFISREPELAALGRAFEQREAGGLVCVHVRGASGVGKSALIRRFLETVREQRRDCVILSGRCYESEAAPHRGLDEFIDHLARFLKSLDRHRAESLLPRYLTWLTLLFPILRDFQPAGQRIPDVPDVREQRYRAFAALRECLARIGDAYPLVVWIDDLQWADSDTVRVLNDIVQAPDPPSLLLILSYRDSDLQTNPVLRALHAADSAGTGASSTRILEIGNLASPEAKKLAEILLRNRPEAGEPARTAEVIVRESKGNPYFIAELVRYASVGSPGGELSAGAFGIGHVIQRRVALLPERALRLLEMIAVAGQPLPADVCSKAALLKENYVATRAMLVREHLLRTHASEKGEELDVYHDQIREAVVGYLSREALKVYNRLLAQALEAGECPDRERLALHFEAAGDHVKAAGYMALAAKDAVKALAFDRAARLYQRMLELGSMEASERHSILEKLGQALSNAGRGPEAAEAFLRASESAEPFRSIDLRRKACEQYLRSGHIDDGMKLCRLLLEQVGVGFPKRRWSMLLLLPLRRVRLRLKLLRFHTTRPSDVSTGQALKLDVCWTVALGMSMVDVLLGADFQSRYTLLALRTREPSRVALGLAAELAMGAIDGQRSPKLTEKLFLQATGVAEQIPDYHALGFANSMRGVAAWLSGEWADGYARSELASEIYREKCAGVIWELTTANAFALSSLVFLGRWQEHARRLPVLVQQAEERGDRYGAISLPLLAYSYVDHLAADQPGVARDEIATALSAWRDEEFHLQHCDALFGQVEILLYEGNAQEAYDVLMRQWPRLVRSNLLEIRFNKIQATALRARTALAVAVSASASPQSAARNLRAAKREASRLSKHKMIWAQAVAALLRAGIAGSEERWDEATFFSESAERLFSQSGMGHFLAVARLRTSQLKGGDEARLNAAQAWMKEQNIRNQSRVANMLAPGRWER